MGACDFYESSSYVDVNKAFQSITENARYEHGSGGYSGTIAEKSDFTILTRTPQSPEELQALQERYSDGDKWGPAYAAPYAEATLGKERTVKVRAKDYQGAEKALREKLKGKSFKIKEMKAIKSPHSLKVKMRRIKGKAKIKYGFSSHNLDPRPENCYDTRAEAIKACEAWLRKKAANFDNEYMPSTTFYLKPIVVIEEHGEHPDNGYGRALPCLAVGEIAVNDRVATWEATIIERKLTGKIAGWAFWGWASS
jgi:hypothetical protein